jgi:DNA-binding MarR family transcriptional regulator
VRLKVKAALKTLPPRERLGFTRPKGIVGATDGNLGAHIATLEQSGYVEIETDLVGKKPRTRVRLTKTGCRAFDGYIAYLRDMVGQE